MGTTNDIAFEKIAGVLARYFLWHKEMDNFAGICINAVGQWSNRALLKDICTKVDSNRVGVLKSRFPELHLPNLGFKGDPSRAEDLEAFAREQIDNGLPFLYELLSVRLWAVLESVVSDIAVILIDSDSSVLAQGTPPKIKVDLIEFLALPAQDRASYILYHLKNQDGANRQLGVGRFECLFKRLDFGGEVDDYVKRGLIELAETRHLSMHRDSQVDDKFKSACPWVATKVGEKFRRTVDHFELYRACVFCYMYVLWSRAHTRFDRGATDAEREVESIVDMHIKPHFTKQSKPIPPLLIK